MEIKTIEPKTSLVKEYTLPTNEYLLEGDVVVKDWYGNIGTCQMDNVTFETDNLTIDTIKANLNDGGYGYQAYVSGKIFVSRKVEIKQITTHVNDVELETPREEYKFYWIELPDSPFTITFGEDNGKR